MAQEDNHAEREHGNRSEAHRCNGNATGSSRSGTTLVWVARLEYEEFFTGNGIDSAFEFVNPSQMVFLSSCVLDRALNQPAKCRRNYE